MFGIHGYTQVLENNRRIGDLGIQLLCEGKNQLRHLEAYEIGMTKVGVRMLLQKLTLEYTDIGANNIYDEELLQLIRKQIPKANLAPRAMETKTYCCFYEAGQLIDETGAVIEEYAEEASVSFSC